MGKKSTGGGNAHQRAIQRNSVAAFNVRAPNARTSVMANQIERWSRSDKLAIALACIGGAMALVIFLVVKTPLTVGITVFCIAVLMMYPVVHFVSSRSARITALLVVFALIGVFGWGVWPKATPVSLITKSPNQEPRPETLSPSVMQIDHLSKSPIPKPHTSAPAATEDCPPGTGFCMVGEGNTASNVTTMDSTRGIVVKGARANFSNGLIISGTAADYAANKSKTEEFVDHIHHYHLNQWKDLSGEELQKRLLEMRGIEEEIRQSEGNPTLVTPLLNRLWALN